MERGILGKKLYFSVNPHAGGGKCRAAWERALPELLSLGIDLTWEYSAGPDKAGAQARAAVCERGAEAVVVVGGDGSLYNVLNGVIVNDRLLRDDLTLAFFPAGTACDFARTIYDGASPSLPALLQNGVVAPVDVGCCTFHGAADARQRAYFLNSFDAGAGADTCMLVNAESGLVKRRLRNGRLAFMLTALRVLMTFPCTEAEVEADGKLYRGRYIIIGAGNGRCAGGGMLLFPRARLDDGRLELLLIEARGRLEILRLLPTVYTGGFFHARGVACLQVEQAVLRTARPAAVELDGEVPGKTAAAVVRVLPRLLPLLRPAEKIRA